MKGKMPFFFFAKYKEVGLIKDYAERGDEKMIKFLT